MSTDNRTTLNACDNNTGWIGDDSATTNTLNGLYYENGTSLSTQLSNSDEYMYTTSIGGTRNLSNATCYMLIKDNLVESQVNGGVKYVLSDGTDIIGYEIGGYDNAGISLAYLFNGYKFDVSNSAAFTAHAFSGSEANLSKTGITGVGFGTLHLAKAQGAIDNCFMDRFSFITNGSAALTINGGTSGTPETLLDVAADDITNGWGLVSNTIGSIFTIFCPTDFGDSGTASSYFSQSDSQIIVDGTGVGTGNFDMNIIANTTGTNLFKLDNCTVLNLGAASNWDMSSNNIDTLEITSCQFTDGGQFTFPIDGGTSRFITGTSFVNCGMVDPSTMTFENIIFNGALEANGALLLNSNADNIFNVTFNSDGTGHAIYIDATGTYNLDTFEFNGYGADGTANASIYNNSGGSVTINITNGQSPTVLNGSGASTTINNNVTVTYTGIVNGSEVRILAAGTSTELDGVESVTGNTFSYSLAAGTSVDVVIFHINYIYLRIPNYTIPAASTTIPIQQNTDRVYKT